MVIAYVDAQIRVLAAGVLLLLSLSLGGCVTSIAGSSLMDARAETPAPPKASVYIPVEDFPSKREKPPMTTDEMSKLKKDLSAARDRQAAAVKGRAGAATKAALPKPH